MKKNNIFESLAAKSVNFFFAIAKLSKFYGAYFNFSLFNIINLKKIKLFYFSIIFIKNLREIFFKFFLENLIVWQQEILLNLNFDTKLSKKFGKFQIINFNA